MDVKQRQLASAEQEVVLRGLAYVAARPHCFFLEVGSWCGHSTVILGKVVREYGGQLFCVDWWKGNSDTELAEIASREDIFSLFWQRIRREGLQDVVVPLRGRSDVVARILKADCFRLVFLDADHRQESVTRDIGDYAPLVCPDGGILCGHDCEGYISDYDTEFLEAGKDRDCHESVHCGVVCAVGTAFADYSLNHSIWSVQALGPVGGWGPTNLTFPGILDGKQAPPPPIAHTQSHNLLRYGRRVYAVPHSAAGFDVTDEEQRNQPGILSAPNLREAEELARQAEACVPEEPPPPPPPPPVPILLEEGYFGFNIVAYDGWFYSLAQDIGPIDLSNLPAADVANWKRQSRFFIADSHGAARLQVAQLGRTATRATSTVC